MFFLQFLSWCPIGWHYSYLERESGYYFKFHDEYGISCDTDPKTFYMYHDENDLPF